jgi:hemolysin activation/secretion protein
MIEDKRSSPMRVSSSELHDAVLRTILATLVLLCGAGSIASAQISIPGAIEPLQRPGESRPDLPEFGTPPPAELRTPAPPPPRQRRLSTEPLIFLRKVLFEGNTVFPDAELVAVAAPFVGREVTSAELQDLRYALSEYYVARGYVNSGAVLPDQDVVDGTVTYRIVEGQLTNITVTGTEGLQESYITNRLALGAGPPLNIEQLRERIQILLQDPLIERLNAELRPGLQPGDSVLDVAVTRTRPFELRASFDNDVSPSIGEFRGRIFGVARNLTGWGDVVDLLVGRTGGLDEIAGGVAVPINRHDTTLSLRFEINNADVVEEPLDELDIRSRQRSFEVGLRQPVYRTPRQQFDLGLTLARQHSETTLLGRPFSFSPGEKNGESDVTVLRFSQSWVSRDVDQVIVARSTFNLGLDWLGATNNSGSIADGQFLSWLGQAQWARRFGEGGPQLIFRTDLQLAKDALLPVEQFAIGGFESVRGYRKNTLVRDSGVVTSLEGRFPMFRLLIPGLSLQAEDGMVHLAPFVDYGRGWNRVEPSVGPKDISSLGVGLRWEVSPDILAQVYYGHALRDLDQPGGGLQNNGVFLSVSARLY